MGDREFADGYVAFSCFGQILEDDASFPELPAVKDFGDLDRAFYLILLFYLICSSFFLDGFSEAWCRACICLLYSRHSPPRNVYEIVVLTAAMLTTEKAH